MTINFWDVEFQVNDAATGDKEFSSQATAVLPDGRIVVVWNGGLETGDGDPSEFGQGVRARILNPDGSPAGDEFVVNTTTVNGQGDAHVAVLTDGRFVITWVSNDPVEGGTVGNIRARVFNADGTAAVYNGSSNDFVVNNEPGFHEVSPTVAALAGGGFVIAYTAPTPGFANIEMRRFTNDGPAAGEQGVNVPGTHNESAVLTVLDDGRYVLGWRDLFQNGSDLVARIFNADGTPAAQGGVQFTLNSGTSGTQFQLHLTTLADGRFVAVWTTDGSVDDNDGSSTGLRGRVFNDDGTPDMTVNGGSDFDVNTTTLHDQRRANVIGLDDGGFLITFWSRTDLEGNVEDTMLGRRFDADGNPTGTDLLVNEGMGIAFGGTGGSPNALVRTPDGRVLSLYNNDPTSNPDIIQGRFFDFSDTGETIDGDGDDETLVGTAFGDIINGGGGNDGLYGGDGGDTLTGGPGSDVMSGGSGGDTYVNAPGDGTDTIRSFVAGAGLDDRIDVTAFGNLQSLADVLAISAQNDADTFINFGGGDTLTLLNVVRNNLVEDDFVFGGGGGNQSPTITSDGGGANATIVVDEDTTAVTTVTAVDPDGPAPTFSLAGGADQVRFQINATTGVLSFITAPDFEAPTDADGDNSYVVQVRASDGGLFDQQTITVNVGDVVPSAASLPGLDEVLWRHTDGAVAAGNNDLPAVSSSWQIRATGDFDGDGDSDIVWSHNEGAVLTWEMENGDYVQYRNLIGVPNNWQVRGTGDFDGDGDADILWRHNDGQVVTWEMQGGDYLQNHNLPVAGNNWQIRGTGDFDGDGDDDILWSHIDGAVVTWEMQDGTYVQNHNLFGVPNTWQVRGTGDFDGDGDDDILWRHNDGQVVTWEMQNGIYLQNHNIAAVPTNYQVAGTWDFDGDNDSDVLWRHNDGTVVTWTMEDGGLFDTDNFGAVANAWQIRGTGEFGLA